MSACFLAPAQVPPPLQMPHVLLSAPVNATWAANHADYWKAKGIDGFLVRGILDTCRGDVWAQDGLPESTGADDAMLSEVRVANRRLSDAGIANNFVLTSLAEDFRGFQRADEAAAAIATFQELATFCADADLQGLALDTVSSSLIFHPNWDGYTRADLRGLHDGARRVGRRLFDAMTSAYPNASLLVLYDGPKSAGPLWPAFMAGVVEGARRARGASIHLLSRATYDVVEPRALVAQLALERDYLALHLDAQGREYWNDRGSVAPGLRPLNQPIEGGEVYAAYPMDSFRVQLAVAKLCAPTYLWIESAGQTWWQVAPDEARSYAALHQLGKAVARQTKPLPAYLASIGAATPLDRFSRVSAPTPALDAPTVLAGTGAAAAVIWPGQPLVLDAGHTPSRVTDLATGATVSTPEDRAELAIERAATPMLVEGLSVSEWLVPASLWLTYDASAVQRWDEAVPLSYGFTNHTPFRLEGVLDLLAPSRWHVGTTHMPFTLEPSRGVDVTTTLRGRGRAGSRVALRCAVTLPASKPRTRTWEIAVPPRLVWSAVLEASPVGPPVWADVDGDGGADLLVTTAGGELACIGPDGTLRWARAIRPGFAFGPLAGRAPAGWSCVVAITTAGVLHVVRGDGAGVAETSLPETPACAPTLGDVHESPGNEFIVLLPSGSLQVWRLDGVRLWEKDTALSHGFVTCLAADGAGGEARIVCAASDLVYYSGIGDELERIPLSAPAACAPAVAHPDADGNRDIFVGTALGTIVRIRGGTKELTDAGVAQSAIYGVTLTDAGTVLLTDAHGVCGLNAGLEKMWSYAVERAAPAAVGQSRGIERYFLGQPDPPRVICVRGDGVVQWEDRSALWGPVTTASCVAVGDRIRFAYGSGEGVVRVGEFQVEP